MFSLQSLTSAAPNLQAPGLQVGISTRFCSKPSIDVGSTSEYGDSYICPPSLEGIRVDGPNRDDKISELF